MEAVSVENLISYEEQALQYLNAKYSKEFEIDEVQMQYIFDGYYDVVAYEAEHPEMLFKASINSDGTGGSDNYYSKLFCRKLSNELGIKLNDLDGLFIIYCTAMIDRIGFNSEEIDTKEYFSKYPNRMHVYLFYMKEDMGAQQIYKSVSDMFKDSGDISGILHLFNVADEEHMRAIKLYINGHDQLYHDYKDLADEFNVGLIKINNGMLDVSENDFINMMER